MLCCPLHSCFGGRLYLFVCLGLVILSTSVLAADDPQTYLFDTGKAAEAALAPAAVADRTGWTNVAEKVLTHAFKGDAVMVNNRLAVVARKNAAGAEVYSLTAKGPKLRAVLTPRKNKEDHAPRISAIRILENTLSGVYLDVTCLLGTEPMNIGFRLVPGDPILEVRQGKGLQEVLVDADISYVVVPNYFGNDMAFSPQSMDDPQVTLAMEQIFLNLLKGGESIIMCVCESGLQDARLLLSGSGKDRRISGSVVQVLSDKKVWMSFIEDAGVWSAMGEGIPAGPQPWTPPFVAKWRVDILREEGIALSLPYTNTTSGGCCVLPSTGSPTNTLPAADLDKLEKVLYPLENDRKTPPTSTSVRDIMRNTLGLGPCEYMIAAEGLNDATPHQVTEWVRKFFDKKEEKDSLDQIKKRFEQMRDHVERAQERIDAYRRLADTVKALTTPATGDPATNQVLTKVAQLGKNLEAAMEIKKPPKEVAASATALSNAIVALAGKPDSQQELNRLVGEIQQIGDLQDRTLANCRVAAKWLKLRCQALAERFPAARELLKKIGDDAEQILKKG